MKNDQREKSSFQDARESINVIYIAAKGIACCVLPFIRCGMGVNALGGSGLIALAIMCAYAASQPAPEMKMYVFAWLLVLTFRRAEARRMLRQGRGEHSCYEGWPWAAMRMPFTGTAARAKGNEPFLCFFVGVFTCPLSEPLGKFLMLGAVGLLLVRVMDLKAYETRLRRMRDGMVEMRQMGEDLRRYR